MNPAAESSAKRRRLADSLGPLAYNLVVDLGLVLLGWFVAGGMAGFTNNPARLALVILYGLAELAGAVLRWRMPEPSPSRPEAWFNNLYRENWRFMNYEMILALGPLSDKRGIFVFPESGWIRAAGLLIFAAGSLWMLWLILARRRHLADMPPEVREPILITSGPWKIVRQPAFLGVFLRGLGVALAFRSMGGLFLLLMMAATVHRRSNWLEKDAAAAVPLQWTAWARKTRRILPRIT